VKVRRLIMGLLRLGAWFAADGSSDGMQAKSARIGALTPTLEVA
jgi:hypothetical protein